MDMDVDDPASKLPMDIIDAIVDTLAHGDPRSLQQYALISRGFLFAARRHLFKAIHIRNSADEQSHGLLAFLSFVKIVPAVCNFVQSLHITGHHPTNDIHDITPHILAPILIGLPYLRKLEFRCVRFSCRDTSEIVMPKPIKLERLFMTWIETSTYTARGFLKIMSLFSEVQDLRISLLLVGKDVPPDVVAAPPHSRVHVHSLTIDEYGTKTNLMFRALLRAIAPESLRVVEFCCPDRVSLNDAGLLFREAGSAIRHIRFDVGHLDSAADWSDDDERLWDLHLQECTALDSLVITPRMQKFNSPTLHLAHTILAHPPTSLRHVTIALNLLDGGQERLKQSNWSHLEGTLSKIPSLESVTFDIHSPSAAHDAPPENEQWNVIKSYLPRLSARDLLRFSEGQYLSEIQH
ncbi:hypothetical protein C8Q75DRAFT_761232 [Abortiporus biennis]|nr:hypothetical protein C8Q75DRAFT_761232 [Abortiporus biennis]